MLLVRCRRQEEVSPILHRYPACAKGCNAFLPARRNRAAAEARAEHCTRNRPVGIGIAAGTDHGNQGFLEVLGFPSTPQSHLHRFQGVADLATVESHRAEIRPRCATDGVQYLCVSIQGVFRVPERSQRRADRCQRAATAKNEICRIDIGSVQERGEGEVHHYRGPHAACVVVGSNCARDGIPNQLGLVIHPADRDRCAAHDGTVSRCRVACLIPHFPSRVTGRATRRLTWHRSRTVRTGSTKVHPVSGHPLRRRSTETSQHFARKTAHTEAIFFAPDPESLREVLYVQRFSSYASGGKDDRLSEIVIVGITR